MAGQIQKIPAAHERLEELGARVLEIAWASADELQQVSGIGPARAAAVVAAFELGRRGGWAPPKPVPSIKLPFQALVDAQAAARSVAVTNSTVDALIAIRDACNAEGISVSDRRWKKSLKVVQANAYLAGESGTTPEDLLILTDSLWREPRERPKVTRLVGELADPVSAKAAEILDAARETAARVAGLRSLDRKAYISNAAQALDEFQAQQAKLTELTRSAGPRAKGTLADATQEIGQLHADLARSVTSGLGLGGLR